MSDQMVLTVEESNGGIDAGDTVIGVISGHDIKTFTYDGDEVSYFELTIEEEQYGMEFTPDWPARITPQTGLGAAVERFGQSLQIGSDVDLTDTFEIGTKVKFEVEEEEAPDDAENDSYLNVDESTVRPVDGPDPEGIEVESEDSTDDNSEESDDGVDEEIQNEVLGYVEEHEGDDESDVKKSLISQLGPDHLKAYKDIRGDEVIVEDGSVMLA